MVSLFDRAGDRFQSAGALGSLISKEVEKMGEFLDKLPANVQSHIKEITKTSGLPNDDESVEKIAEGWLQKKDAFEDQLKTMNMEEVQTLGKEDPKGALAITYSGSIINIGPLVDGGRSVEYSSVGLRSDVPASATKEGSKLGKDIKVDASIEFEVGPVKSTSAIFKIAVCKGNLSAEKQEEKITQATQMLKEEFVNVNKTVILE
jgi:hypothetical protein